jgi:hypothetical protein
LRRPLESAQFVSLAFGQKARDAGIAPSMGAVESPYDNAMVEAFWGRMQVELFNRTTWTTRIELATAIHDYIELFYNLTPPPQRPGNAHPDRIREPLLTHRPGRLTQASRLREIGVRSKCPRNSEDAGGVSVRI